MAYNKAIYTKLQLGFHLPCVSSVSKSHPSNYSELISAINIDLAPKSGVLPVNKETSVLGMLGLTYGGCRVAW